MKKIILFASIIASGLLSAATIDLADVLVDGATSYTVNSVSSGDGFVYNGTATVDLVFDLSADSSYAGAVSVIGNIRLVKRGEGILALTAANAYTGGTLIEAGILAVSDSGALGAGAVSIVATSSESKPCRLRIDAAMTFTNDINISGGLKKSGGIAPGATKLNGLASIDLNVTDNVTLSGKITSLCDIYLWDANKNKTRTFSGLVSAEGCHIVASPYNSKYVFSGGVKASAFYATYVYMHMNSVCFQDNPVDIEKLVVAYTKVELYDVLGAGVILHQDGSSDPVRTVVSLRDDVTVGGWTTPSKENAEKLLYPIRCLPNVTDARTFTIKATASGTSYGTLRDNVTLVYDPASSVCTQTLTSISQRTHDTKGAIVIKRGAFKVGGAVSLPDLTAIRVADDAAFLADTKGTTAFVGLKDITVGANAVFFCAGNTASPFSTGKMKLTIGAGSSVSLPAEETVSVSELWRDGVRMRGGVYTPDGADGTRMLAELKSGAVYVPDFAGESQISIWTGSVDSDVATAGNWKGDSLPDWESGGVELVFADEGCGSTTAVVSGPVDVKRIVFRQPLGFTLGSTGDGFVKLLEGVSFGDIGEAAPRYTIDVPLEIVGNQTWTLPSRADSVVTLSKPLLSNPNAGGGMLFITNDIGTLDFHMTNSTYTGSLFAQAGMMSVSGENVFGPEVSGSTVTLKLNHHNNTAKCYFKGCSVSKPLICTMPISGQNYQIFDCVAGTTNVFNGHVTLPQWTKFQRNSYTVFESGARISGYNRQYLEDGAVVVFRGGLLNYHNDGGNHGMSPVVPDGEYARFVIACPVGIEASEWADIDAGLTLDIRYEQAFSAGKWKMHGTMLLNGHSQAATRFMNSNGMISSTNAPAFVELNLPAGAAETNALKFTDLAGFKMSGAGFVRMNGVSTSSGALAVENGTVELGAATWLNATNVVVGGTGVLKFTKSNAFDRRKAVLSLSGAGAIDLPEGVRQRFLAATVTVDGEEQKVPAGTYGADATGLMAGRVTGGGTITVISKGFSLIVR